MKLFYRLTVFVILVCLFAPAALYADTKFKSLEEMWKNRKYEKVIPKLLHYRKKVTNPGVRLMVDYMLATSWCKAPNTQSKGKKALTRIPYIYRHISRYNYRAILNEKNNCNSSNLIVARLSKEPPGVYGKGGISQKSLEISEKEFSDTMKKFDSRIYKIKRGFLSRLFSKPEDKMKNLAGSGYNAVIHGHFIVVGNLPESELHEEGKDLEETITRFLTQFKMEEPKYYTTVYLFPSSDKMVEFARKNHEIDIPPSMWGYTFAYDSSIVIRTSGGMGTIGHEVFHALLNHNFPESPPWLNEGMSALFEEFKWEEDRMVGTYRKKHWRIRYLVRDRKKRSSISELIAMDWSEFDDKFAFHYNHATAKFFAMYLQDKLKKLENVYQAFRNENFLEGSGDIAEKNKEVLLKTLDKKSIDEIDDDFHLWLIQKLPRHH